MAPRPAVTEARAAALLLAATGLALAWANSPASGTYEALWGSGPRHWVDDGLMVLFFLGVGLELRHELTAGELRDPRKAMVPAVAALAGMAVPAAIYVALSPGGEAARGWGIVMATDIAFVLGALALLGRGAPPALRVFLLTLAIVDDIGAIAVIAVFYTEGIDLVALALAAAFLAAFAAVGRVPIPRGPAYLVAGLGAWIAVAASGVHPTIAGVALGLLAPSGERLQAALRPWTALVIVPLFALANAGVPLGGDALERAARSPVTLGIVVGLVAGKAAGISFASLGAVRLGGGSLPRGMGTGGLLGASALAGIGFTVSLFVTGLAFEDPRLQEEAKVGVLAASVLAAALGWLVLRAGALRR